MKKRLRQLGLVLILCLPALPIGAYIGAFFIPRVYYSEADYQLDPHHYANFNVEYERLNKLLTHDKLLSQDFLQPVIDELRLGEKWADGNNQLPQEEIFSRLLKMLDIKRDVQNVNLLKIGVYSTDPVEAANIANTITLHCNKLARDIVNDQRDSELRAIENAIVEERITVIEAELEVAKIRPLDSIDSDAHSDQDAKIPNPTEYKSSEQYRKAENDYIQKKKQLELIQSRLETLKMETKIAIDDLPAKISQKAEPSLVPVRPNVSAMLWKGLGIGLLLAIIGLVLLKSTTQ